MLEMKGNKEGISPRPTLRLHAVLPLTLANGPGRRFGVWVQGCRLGCPGCFNPETHDPSGGYPVEVRDLLRQIASAGGEVEGVTVSGGEPLEQAGALRAFLSALKAETGLSVVLFSGFTREEIEARPDGPAILARTDVLVAGPFEAARRLGRGLRGSDNQAVHFLSGRYAAADLEGLPDAEIVIRPDGSVTRSGFPPWPETVTV